MTQFVSDRSMRINATTLPLLAARARGGRVLQIAGEPPAMIRIIQGDITTLAVDCYLAIAEALRGSDPREESLFP